MEIYYNGGNPFIIKQGSALISSCCHSGIRGRLLEDKSAKQLLAQIILLEFLTVIFSDCPAEFVHDVNRGFCHKVVWIGLGRDAAATQCEQWDSGLVSIETEEEHNYLSSLPTGK